MNNQNLLGTQKIGKLMMKFSLPCVISLLVGALYNIVDQIFIANATYLWSFGNAANTVVFPLTIVALAIAVMIGDGCCSYVSIHIGMNEEEKASKSIGNSILIMLISSIVLMFSYLLFCDQLLKLFGGNVNNETFVFAKEYFLIIAIGIPFYMFGQGINPIIRSDGNPRFAMVSIMIGAITNVILDPIFIFICKWGMKGAAIATVIGQIITALVTLWYLFHMKGFKLIKKDYKLDFKIIKQTLVLGICSFFAQISLVFSLAATNNMLKKYGSFDPIFGLNEYSQIPMAIVGVVYKVYQIAISIAIGMAAGCIPIIGYNIGAKQYKRVKELLSKLIIYESLVGLVALSIVEIIPKGLLSLFGASNESIYYVEFGIKTFRIYLSMIIFACINKATFIFLQAMGKAFSSTVLSMIREIILGVGLVLLLPIWLQLDGVLLSMPLADILTFIISFIIILKTYNELNNQEKNTIPFN